MASEMTEAELRIRLKLDEQNVPLHRIPFGLWHSFEGLRYHAVMPQHVLVLWNMRKQNRPCNGAAMSGERLLELSRETLLGAVGYPISADTYKTISGRKL